MPACRNLACFQGLATNAPNPGPLDPHTHTFQGVGRFLPAGALFCQKGLPFCPAPKHSAAHTAQVVTPYPDKTAWQSTKLPCSSWAGSPLEMGASQTHSVQATCTMTVRSSCRPACLHGGRAPCSRAHAHSLSCAHRQVRQGQVALQPAHLAVARPRARRRCGCIEQQGSTQLVTGMRKLECTSAGSASCKHPRATCLPATGDAPRVAVEGDTVVLHYVCRDESGNIVDDSREHSEPVRLLL